jgi:hypothetical protein
MTAVCPDGHVSETLDYCDQCGARLAPAAPAESSLVVEEMDTSPAARHEPCPVCRAPRSGDDRYCEGCGYDYVTRAAPAAPAASTPQAADGGAPEMVLAAWEAVASADRQQFDALGSAGIAFPGDYLERRFALTLDRVRIGRSRGRDGEQIPEIDLRGRLEDPGVSHLHAALERQDDGSYALRDLGSTNGTTVNDDPAPVGEELTAPLGDGDRIRLGAWTTITLRRR